MIRATTLVQTRIVAVFTLGMMVSLMVAVVAGDLTADDVTEHHQLLIQLDPDKHRLDAIDRLTLENFKDNHVTFLLASHVAVNHVRVNGAAQRHRFRRGVLDIPLSATTSSHRIEIAYSGVFDDNVSSNPLNTDNPGYGVTGAIQPQGTLLLSGAGWYPYSERHMATYEITVDAPKGIMAVTTGQLLGHSHDGDGTRSRWLVKKPFRGLSLVAGPFQLKTLSFGRVSAATYFTDAIQRLSPDYLKATGRYITFYEDLFGPYPFDRFAVVENFFPTGYGFPSFTLMGRRVLQLPFIIHTSLGHEIAHCWWGNGVMVDASQGNWSEGLTTYVADYLYKEQQGKGADYRRQWLRNYANLVKPSDDLALSNFSSRNDPVTKTIGYDKAAMVFHMLRRLVGDDAFWQTLRDVYARHQFQAISWSHWQRAFEKNTGRPLDGFFQQWVFRPGAPQFRLSQVTTEPTAKGYRIQGHIAQTKPYYDFAVDLVLQGDAGSVKKQVAIAGARTPFVVETASPPQTLTVDQEAHLFRRMFPQEIPATINSVKGADSLWVVVSRDLDDSWERIAQRFIVALGLDSNTPIVREGDVADSSLRRHDLLWVGLPADKRWWPNAFRQFTLNDQVMTVDGQSVSRGAASLFSVFEHPFHKGGIMAVFSAPSHVLAKSVSAKVTHYGKYSYLLFEGGRNRIKGTWPITQSPLIFNWPEHS